MAPAALRQGHRRVGRGQAGQIGSVSRPVSSSATRRIPVQGQASLDDRGRSSARSVSPVEATGATGNRAVRRGTALARQAASAGAVVAGDDGVQPAITMRPRPQLAALRTRHRNSRFRVRDAATRGLDRPGKPDMPQPVPPEGRDTPTCRNPCPPWAPVHPEMPQPAPVHMPRHSGHHAWTRLAWTHLAVATCCWSLSPIRIQRLRIRDVTVDGAPSTVTSGPEERSHPLSITAIRARSQLDRLQTRHGDLRLTISSTRGFDGSHQRRPTRAFEGW